MFEDTKRIIRSRKWKKEKQHNGQKKKNKRTNNYLQNIHIQLKVEQHDVTTANTKCTMSNVP